MAFPADGSGMSEHPISAQMEITRLLNQIRGLSSNPTIAKCSDEIELMCRAYMEVDQSPLINLPGAARLTRMEHKTFNLLLARKNKTVSCDAIMSAMYSDQPEDEPGIKIVQVRMCKMREKLRNSGIIIETIWGVGYRLTDRDPGQEGSLQDATRRGNRKYWAA